MLNKMLWYAEKALLTGRYPRGAASKGGVRASGRLESQIVL